MAYLFSQMFWCLLIATVIGAIVGWFLRRARARRDEEGLLGRISQYETQKNEYEAQKKETDAKVQKLAADLVTTKQSKTTLEGELRNVQDESRRTLSAFESVKDTVRMMEEENAQEIADLNARLSNLQTQVTAKDAQIVKFNNRVQELELLSDKVNDYETSLAEAADKYSTL
ncbi:MAG: hypothetical protein ACR2RB_13575, partial [Gammaproteobacteria bacterium]